LIILQNLLKILFLKNKKALQQ